MELDSGTTIGDRYVIDEIIGEGGMAVVYRAHHIQLQTQHAVKVLTISARSVRERMLQEGRVQASLRHPNIVSVTDVVTIAGAPALVMEFIEGPPLDVLILQQKLTLDQADTIGRGILAAVAHAHDRGLIHRDLKPANIMLEIENGEVRPKVMDFGLAKLLDSDAKVAATRTGSTMGTPQYMSPEQITDSKNVDERSDVFALGAILYELVTGERAFDGDNVLEIFKKVSVAERIPVRELRPDAPDRMVRAIEAALVVDREARIQSTRALFEMFTGGEPLPAASFSSAEMAAMSGHSLGASTLDSSAAVGTMAPGVAPAVAPRSAPSIVSSPVVIGGGLFAVGAIVLAVVILLGGGVALYVSMSDPSEIHTSTAPTPAVEPVAPTDQPVKLPEPSLAPGPVVSTRPSPPGKSSHPSKPAPDPHIAPASSETPAPVQLPDPSVDTDVPVPPPSQPEPSPEPLPPPPEPVSSPPSMGGITIDNVPASMRSASSTGPAAIWNNRNDREPRMNDWLTVLMKDKHTQPASRAKAVEVLVYRWKKGEEPQGELERSIGWAARYSPRASKIFALNALQGRGTNVDPVLAALKSKDAVVQGRALDAIAAIAGRSGQEGKARAAIEAYLQTQPSGRNLKKATAALNAL